MKSGNLFALLSAGFVIFSLVGCKDNSEEIARMNLELEELKARGLELKTEEDQTSNESNEMRAKIRRVKTIRRDLVSEQQKLAPLEEYYSRLEEGIAHYEKEIATWREAHRKSLAGMKVASIPKVDGTSLTNVEILEVRDEEVVLKANGIEKTVPMTAFTEPVQRRFIFEPFFRAEIAQ